MEFISWVRVPLSTPEKVPDLIRFSSLVFLFYVGIIPGIGCCSNFFVILDFSVVWYSTGIVFGVAIGYHNAEITLESAPGKGTAITVQF